MMVTEGGGAGSFGAAGGFGSPWGGPASFCAQEAPTAVVAKATAIKMNRRLARIRPPELLHDPNGPRSKSRAATPISALERSRPGSGRVFARPPARPRRHGGAPQGRRLKGQAADRE